MDETFEWLHNKRRIGFFLGLMAFDRILKLLALSQWATTPLFLQSWLAFGLESNTGIAWGLGSSDNMLMHGFLIVCMVGALLGITYKGILEWCAGRPARNELLIVIGGLSNLFDRIQYGAVIDFVQIFIGNYRLSVFNLADVYIVVGLALILKRAWADGSL